MTDISSQLIEQVNTARAQGKKLNILGRGSKKFLGRQRSGEPVCVAEHRGIVSYQAVELVITARAGTSVSEIEAVLDEQGQMLSFEPPSFAGVASIGGTLACNASGPARPWGGSIRDMVLGTRLINSNGEHLRFGGQVMKNVAGYDVSRAQAGAMGTLGLITEISLKVLPKPDASITLTQEMDAQQAIWTMNTLSGKAKPLSGACWLDNKLYLRWSGTASAVYGTARQYMATILRSAKVLENAHVFWGDLKEQQLSFFSGNASLWRFSLQSSSDHFLPQGDWLIDWGGSQRWLRGADYNRLALEQAATQACGQLSLYRGGDRSGEVFHSQAEPLKLIHQRLKSAFDPDGLFNPGRLYTWL